MFNKEATKHTNTMEKDTKSSKYCIIPCNANSIYRTRPNLCQGVGHAKVDTQSSEAFPAQVSMRDLFKALQAKESHLGRNQPFDILILDFQSPEL